MLNTEMSILQEVNRVINVMKLPVTKCHQTASLTDATSIQNGLIFVPDLCVAHDCFMILRLRSCQASVLSRGSQRPNLPYKMALLGVFG